jgi:hypothetical protein
VARFASRVAGPAILFVITIGIFWKLVLTRQYTWLDQPDFVNQVLPWFQFQAREWHAGHFPLWDPYHWGGQSLIGQAQPGAAYPLNWLLFLLPLRDGWIQQPYLHWYFVLIHYMGALFCYWLCRDLKRSVPASILAGAAFGLSGFVGHTDWPQMLNGAVWAPVVFLFFLRAMRGESPVANSALSGAALGFSFLSGHHQIPIFVALAVGAAWIYHWALAEIPRLRIAALGCLFGLFAAVTSGFQTLPAYEYGKLALRWVNATQPVGWNQPVPYFVHGLFSLGVPSILGVIIPGLHSGADPFIGLVVVSLALLAIAGDWSDRTVRFFAALALGALIFSLGADAVFHGVVYALIPMVEKARSPASAIVIFHLGAAVLAAYGLDTLRARSEAWIWGRRAVWTLLVLAAVLYTGLGAWAATQPEKAFSHAKPPGLAMAALAALLLAALLGGWRKRGISFRSTEALLILLMILETGAVTGFYYRHRDGEGYFLSRMRDNTDVARFLYKQPFPIRAEIDRSLIPFNWGDWFGVDMFEGYCGVTKNVFQYNGENRFRDLFAIGYYIGAKPAREGQAEIFHGSNGVNVYANPGDHKRVWAVHQAAQIRSSEALMPALDAPGFDARRQALLLEPAPKLETCDAADTVRLVASDPNRLVIDADLGCRAMIIAGETFAPGWQAKVDGKPAPVYQAYTAVRGVVADAGHHRVEMRYRPASVLVGAIMTACGLLGALLFWISTTRTIASSDSPTSAARALSPRT